MEMSRVKDGNYYVVQSFMVKDLKLKGLELSCYAIIYGFSQAEGQVFNGSLQYLADWSCASKQAIMTALKKLVDKKLLTKNDKFVNGVKFVEYSATDYKGMQETCMGVGNKVEEGIQESCIPPMKETRPNNIPDNIEKRIDNNIDTDKKDKSVTTPLPLVKILIDNFYIEESEPFLDQYNFLVDELTKQYGFEVVRACIYYHLQRWTGYDNQGKPILNKFGYLKIALEGGAKRLAIINKTSDPFEGKPQEATPSDNKDLDNAWKELLTDLNRMDEEEQKTHNCADWLLGKE